MLALVAGVGDPPVEDVTVTGEDLGEGRVGGEIVDFVGVIFEVVEFFLRAGWSGEGSGFRCQAAFLVELFPDDEDLMVVTVLGL